MYDTTCSVVSTNMYVEVKPKNTKLVEVLNDFHKIAIFGKVGLKHSSTGAVMTFRSLDNHVFFYLNYCVANYGFICLDLGDFEIPTTKGTLMSNLGSLPLMYKLAYIYNCTCLDKAQVIPDQDNFSGHTTTLSFSLGKSLISNKDNKKRRSACL
ncbi:hypothetical protein EDC96DRAFT_541946 [Choanephora cucurbitarum]|nr:hypothetical protein EDC96DRAFT_541946 [Choanephora cucurbitarum]